MAVERDFLTTKGTEITKCEPDEIAFPHRHLAEKWVRRAADPYLPFFCLDSSSTFRALWRDSRFNLFLTPMATSGRGTAAQPYQLF